MEEQWFPVRGFEGLYEVSTGANIRSVDGRLTNHARWGRRRCKGVVLRQRWASNGYKVDLCKDHKSYSTLVARIVCEAFHGAPENEGMTVNHKDGDRSNNTPNNLEWMTRGDNIRHAFANGMMVNSCRKVVLSKGEERHEFYSASEASRFLGRCSSYVTGAQSTKSYPFVTSKLGERYKVEELGEYAANRIIHYADLID